MKPARAALALPLLLGLACQPRPSEANLQPYAQVDEGLTLVFTDPSSPDGDKPESRLQVRVDKALKVPDGALLVTKSMGRGLNPPSRGMVLVKDGGVSFVNPGRPAENQVLLPAGFPDRTTSWTDAQKTRYRVLGRAAWGGASILAPGTDAVGVWVEAEPQMGPRSRQFYLRGLGEVESLEERPGGGWICVNRLAQYGYTDLPTSPQPKN